MRVTGIRVKASCNLSPESYNNIQREVQLEAQLDPGDDPQARLAELSETARAGLVEAVLPMTAELSDWRRRNLLALIGVRIEQEIITTPDDDFDDDYTPDSEKFVVDGEFVPNETITDPTPDEQT